MSEPIEGTQQFTATQAEPEFYVRINLSKTSAGWRHETTVSLRWKNRWWTDGDTVQMGANRTDFLVSIPPSPDSTQQVEIERHPSRLLRELLRQADDEARAEIARREAVDAGDPADAP